MQKFIYKWNSSKKNKKNIKKKNRKNNRINKNNCKKGERKIKIRSVKDYKNLELRNYHYQSLVNIPLKKVLMLKAKKSLKKDQN